MSIQHFQVGAGRSIRPWIWRPRSRFSHAGWWLTYPSEKYEFVNGKDDIPYMKWKKMFETTNQLEKTPLSAQSIW